MDDIDLLAYLHMLKHRKWTVAAMALAVMLLTGIALLVMPRVYEGETTLIFPRQSSGSLGNQLSQLTGLPISGTLGGFSGRDAYVTVLKSRSIGEAVIEELGLDAKYGLRYEDVKDSVVLRIPKEGNLVLVCEAPTSWLRGYVPGSELGERTAELAAEIANAYIAELEKFDKSNSLFLSKRNRIFIEEQLAKTRLELADAERRLKDFQEAHPTLAPPSEASAFARRAMELTAQQTETDITLEEIKHQIDTVRKTWREGAPEGISPDAFITSPIISDLQAQLAETEVKRATLLEEYTETHPSVVGLGQEIQKIQDKIASETARIIKGKTSSLSPAHQELLKQLAMLEVSRNGLAARQSGVTKALEQIESTASELPAQEMVYSGLIRDVKMQESVYTTLQTEYAKARIEESKEANNFMVLDKAKAQEKPTKPRKKLIMAAALMMGLLLGVMVAGIQGAPKVKRSG